jgi:hypothetical protein
MPTKQDRIRFALYMVSFRMGVQPTHSQMEGLVNLMQYCLEHVESDLIENFITDIDMLDLTEGYRGLEC